MAAVCLYGNALRDPEGGGHVWVYLNWALGLRELGCSVVWLESARPADSTETLRVRVGRLRRALEPYGLGDSLAIYGAEAVGCLDLEAASEADLLLNLGYARPELVERFPRSVFVDLDPGLSRMWIESGKLALGRHALYCTIGEPPDRTWTRVLPCVALECWEPAPADPGAAFTTVSQWWADQWAWDDGGLYRNDKRTGFLPFLDLPALTAQPLELALRLAWDDVDGDEPAELRRRGWRVRDALSVAGTPWSYRRYIRASLGEFSCAKPSCMRMQNGWISDRTACYLASGKPAVVQQTGPIPFEEGEGLVRFRDLNEAARALDEVAADYDRHSAAARRLAEEHFAAPAVLRPLLERALG